MVGHEIDGGQGGRGGDGVPTEGAAEATCVHVAHQLGPARHRRQGQAARDALGHGHQVRDDAVVLACEPRARTAKSRLHLIGDEEDPVVAAPGGQGGQEAGRGHHKAALALHRLDQDARHVARAHLLFDQLDGAPGGVASEYPAGSRNGYDIGTRYTSGANGPKPSLYGMFLAVSAMVRLVRP